LAPLINCLVDNLLVNPAAVFVREFGATPSLQHSPAAKSKNISLCGEIMKLGTLVADTCTIIYRLGPTSETPPGARHLEFKNGRHIRHIFAYNF